MADAPRRPLVIRADHSHLWPGCRLQPDQPPATGEVVIAFADGAIATGRLEIGSGETGALELRPYTTARGTAIPGRRWGVGIEGSVLCIARGRPVS